MRFLPRTIALLWALTLLGAANFTVAQDETQVAIVGSGIANSLIEAVAESLSLDDIELTTTGTAAGIEQFCGGGQAVASAVRPISAAEAASCLENEVEYSEFLIAHRIVAFAANGSLPATCLSRSQLESFLKPSMSNQATDWSALVTEGEAPSLTMLAPPSGTLEYVIVDELVAGDRLRRDVQVYGDISEAIALATETAGALAILPYSPALIDHDDLVVLGFEDGENANCIAPSAENVEANLYSAAQSVYVYVSRAALQSHDTLAGLIEQLTAEVNADALVSAGFSPPSAEAYAMNAQMLADPTSSVAKGDGETDFVIPPNLSGELRVSGAANALQLLERSATPLTTNNPQLQVNLMVSSAAAAIGELCAGELEIALVDAPFDQHDVGACEDQGVQSIWLPIGSQATVLLGNSADDFSECLTHDQIMRIWLATSADAVSSWNEVDESYPGQELVLLAPFIVDRYADMLLAQDGEATAPVRRDIETSFDPLYRAAAVGNVSGALTYLSWPDYLDVLDNDQANVRPVGVDVGAGCLIPEAASIGDGTYPLSRSARLLVSESALADINAQSLLWSLYSDDSWDSFQREGFAGLEYADFAARRRQLETQFRLAESRFAADVNEANDEPADESG